MTTPRQMVAEAISDLPAQEPVVSDRGRKALHKALRFQGNLVKAKGNRAEAANLVRAQDGKPPHKDPDSAAYRHAQVLAKYGPDHIQAVLDGIATRAERKLSDELADVYFAALRATKPVLVGDKVYEERDNIAEQRRAAFDLLHLPLRVKQVALKEEELTKRHGGEGGGTLIFHLPPKRAEDQEIIDVDGRVVSENARIGDGEAPDAETD